MSSLSFFINGAIILNGFAQDILLNLLISLTNSGVVSGYASLPSHLNPTKMSYIFLSLMNNDSANANACARKMVFLHGTYHFWLSFFVSFKSFILNLVAFPVLFIRELEILLSHFNSISMNFAPRFFEIG